MLQCLQPYRDRMTLLGGLSHPLSRNLLGHLAGDTWLTAGDLRGDVYKNRVSVDQVAADAIAVAIGALVATFNGLSSAQLAANHPVSGGTYEYGYQFLTPRFGFTAGWMFLLAKSASAATAALG